MATTWPRGGASRDPRKIKQGSNRAVYADDWAEEARRAPYKEMYDTEEANSFDILCSEIMHEEGGGHHGPDIAIAASRTASSQSARAWDSKDDSILVRKAQLEEAAKRPSFEEDGDGDVAYHGSVMNDLVGIGRNSGREEAQQGDFGENVFKLKRPAVRMAEHGIEEGFKGGNELMSPNQAVLKTSCNVKPVENSPLSDAGTRSVGLLPNPGALPFSDASSSTFLPDPSGVFTKSLTNHTMSPNHAVLKTSSVDKPVDTNHSVSNASTPDFLPDPRSLANITSDIQHPTHSTISGAVDAISENVEEKDAVVPPQDRDGIPRALEASDTANSLFKTPLCLYRIINDGMEKRSSNPNDSGATVAWNASGTLLHLIQAVIEDICTILCVVGRTSNMLSSMVSKLITHAFAMSQTATLKLQRLHAALGRILGSDGAMRILAKRLGSCTLRSVRSFNFVCHMLLGSLLTVWSLIHQKYLPYIAKSYHKAVMASKARAAKKLPVFSLGPLTATLDSEKLPGEFVVHDLLGVDREHIGFDENEGGEAAHPGV